MKTIAIIIVLVIVLLAAFSFASSTGKIDMGFASDWFSDEEDEEVEKTDVVCNISGKYQLVGFDSIDPDNTTLGFTEQSVSFGLIVEDKKGNVTSYNVNRITWEQVGDVKFYYFGSYVINPGTASDVYLYADFGEKKQEVSEGFYKWFEDHFKAVEELPEILCSLEGSFKFKKSISFGSASELVQPFTFTSNSETFTKILLSRATSSGAYCDMYYCTDSVVKKVWSYTDGWLDEAYRIVDITKDSVSFNFYCWFISSATSYIEDEDPDIDTTTYKIVSGTYSWNGSVTYPEGGDITQEITATWNGEDVTTISISCIDGQPEGPVIMVNGSFYAYYDTGFDGGWDSDITVTESIVSKEFYEWFAAHTTRKS